MPRRAIKFGVHYHPEGVNFDTVKTLCQRAEELDYDLFTVTDHFLNMDNSKSHVNHPIEAWTLLSALAAVTKKIQLGPLVSCAHYRHPTVLAKMATTVDIISGGRLVFGIGAGWYRDEFETFLGTFPSTKDRVMGLRDAVQICKSMFENERTNFTGRIYSAADTLNLPRPVRGRIPIMIGGAGETVLGIMSKYADIAHVWDHFLPSELDQRLQSLRKQCDKVGRPFDDLAIGTGLNVILTPKPERIRVEAERISKIRQISVPEAERIVHRTAGAENILETIRQYQDLRVTLITIVGLEQDELDEFRTEVALKLNN